MESSGILSIGSYLRKMALDGYCLHLDRPQAVQVIFHFMPWLLFEFFSKGSFILSNSSFSPFQAKKSGLDSIPEV